MLGVEMTYKRKTKLQGVRGGRDVSPMAKPHVSTLDPKHCPICAALSCILHSLAPVAPQQKMPAANSSQGTALLSSGCPQPRDPSPSWTL